MHVESVCADGFDCAEHGHSHGSDHGSSTSPISEVPPRVASPELPAAAALGGGVIPLATQTSRHSRHTRPESMHSLYGHPVQTRQAVVQAAEDYYTSEGALNDGSLDAIERGDAGLFETSAKPTPESFGAGATPALTEIKDKDENDTRVVLKEIAEPVKKAKSGTAHGHGHSHGADGSMNIRGVIIHVFGDALSSLGVVISGLIMWLTPLKWRFYFDPLLSVIIIIIILFSAIPLGKSFNLDGYTLA